MATEVIDMGAREIAVDARNKIITHEDVCAERWRNQRDAMGTLHKDVRMLARQMWAANAMLISALLGAIAWLADHTLQ